MRLMVLPSDGKLVRDRIPAILAEAGVSGDFVEVSEADLPAALVAKLHEETDELAIAESTEVIGELADLYEVVAAFAAIHGYSMAEVATAADRKRAERGGFADRCWLRS